MQLTDAVCLFGRRVPESVSGLVWIGLLMSVAVVTAQVNVQFDGEMLAQESSRSTRQSWPPWRRRSPADRPESSSSRPLYLADPRPSGQRRRIPPPPVLSHLTAPHAGRLPSLRFSPSRERQQYQWYPRPPPGALPSTSAPADAPDVQNWRGPDRSASERSPPGGIRRADGPAGLQHQQAFPPERPAAGSQPGDPDEPMTLSVPLGEDDDDQQRDNQPGIRLLSPAPAIYGRPVTLLPPAPVGDPPRRLDTPPLSEHKPQPALPTVLPHDELFERINQETEAMWAAAGGGGGEGQHQVDSTVFDIELSPPSGAISPAVRHAVIASGAVGGCALLIFVGLMAFCRWRQRRDERALGPCPAADSERSSSPLDPSRINVNNYANAYRTKTTGFWGSLRKSFNQRYAAAYSDTPYGGVTT
ncbi:hypothetical protein FJT64_014964 [Amphibalanus amphitrite]|uniref:Transmembrane protein n=1 Tax=Amphibalanus amphitrite TaxID=1232801 RepID=A0A6A4X5S8_AMPAM|nr:hypothetical protein FJT64_014964 [Amphibalanus amphitrite]